MENIPDKADIKYEVLKPGQEEQCTPSALRAQLRCITFTQVVFMLWCLARKVRCKRKENWGSPGIGITNSRAEPSTLYFNTPSRWLWCRLCENNCSTPVHTCRPVNSAHVYRKSCKKYSEEMWTPLSFYWKRDQYYILVFLNTLTTWQVLPLNVFPWNNGSHVDSFGTIIDI